MAARDHASQSTVPTLEMNATQPLIEAPYLPARRHQGRGRRSLVRADIGLGLLVAGVALLLAPGLAIVAVAALLAIVVCVNWILLEQWRSRRR